MTDNEIDEYSEPGYADSGAGYVPESPGIMGRVSEVMDSKVREYSLWIYVFAFIAIIVGAAMFAKGVEGGGVIAAAGVQVLLSAQMFRFNEVWRKRAIEESAAVEKQRLQRNAKIAWWLGILFLIGALIALVVGFIFAFSDTDFENWWQSLRPDWMPPFLWDFLTGMLLNPLFWIALIAAAFLLRAAAPLAKAWWSRDRKPPDDGRPYVSPPPGPGPGVGGIGAAPTTPFVPPHVPGVGVPTTLPTLEPVTVPQLPTITPPPTTIPPPPNMTPISTFKFPTPVVASVLVTGAPAGWKAITMTTAAGKKLVLKTVSVIADTKTGQAMLAIRAKGANLISGLKVGKETIAVTNTAKVGEVTYAVLKPKQTAAILAAQKAQTPMMLVDTTGQVVFDAGGKVPGKVPVKNIIIDKTDDIARVAANYGDDVARAGKLSTAPKVMDISVNTKGQVVTRMAGGQAPAKVQIALNKAGGLAIRPGETQIFSKLNQFTGSKFATASAAKQTETLALASKEGIISKAEMATITKGRTAQLTAGKAKTTALVGKVEMTPKATATMMDNALTAAEKTSTGVAQKIPLRARIAESRVVAPVVQKWSNLNAATAASLQKTTVGKQVLAGGGVIMAGWFALDVMSLAGSWSSSSAAKGYAREYEALAEAHGAIVGLTNTEIDKYTRSADIFNQEVTRYNTLVEQYNEVLDPTARAVLETDLLRTWQSVEAEAEALRIQQNVASELAAQAQIELTRLQIEMQQAAQAAEIKARETVAWNTASPTNLLIDVPMSLVGRGTHLADLQEASRNLANMTREERNRVEADVTAQWDTEGVWGSFKNTYILGVGKWSAGVIEGAAKGISKLKFWYGGGGGGGMAYSCPRCARTVNAQQAGNYHCSTCGGQMRTVM